MIEALVCLMVLAILGVAVLDTTMFSGKIIERARILRQLRENLSCVVVAEYIDVEPESMFDGSSGLPVGEIVELPLGTNMFHAVKFDAAPVADYQRGLIAFVRKTPVQDELNLSP